MKHDPQIIALALGAKVDQLGALKAQIAPLTKDEAALKDDLKASGLTEIDGQQFRATISHSEAEGLNLDRVRALLDDLVDRGVISHQKRASLNTKTSRTTVRVVAQTRRA